MQHSEELTKQDAPEEINSKNMNRVEGIESVFKLSKLSPSFFVVKKQQDKSRESEIFGTQV